jgi:RNA recognition motif-containing protein
MTKKLFVGNLPFAVTDFDLEDLFKGYGEVTSAKVIVDRRTGRSRGYGFVEMGTEDLAQQAIEALHGTELKGRPINVSLAKEQTEGGGGRDRGGFSDGGGFGSAGGDSGGGFRKRDSYNNNY